MYRQCDRNPDELSDDLAAREAGEWHGNSPGYQGAVCIW
jgi:hypothetical protein